MMEIIYSVLIFIITGSLGYIVKKYFWNRPKLSINIKFHFGNSSAPNNYSILELVWHKNIVLTNVTNHRACNVKVFFQNDSPKFNFTNDGIINIDKFSEQIFDLTFLQNYDREDVLKVKDRFKDLLPEYYKKLSILLEYNNEHHKKFYTLFTNDESGGQNKYLRKKPKRAI